MAKIRTSRRVCACSRGGSVSSVLSDWPILPISLRVPVAITSAIAVPRTTSEPENTHGQIVAAGPPAFGRPAPARAILRTGTDSPVSSDSSVCRSLASTSTASAGTRSPSASTRRSPRTTSRPAMRLRSPSRMTSARGLVRSRSASSTRSVRLSCTTVITIDSGREDQQDERLLQVAEQQVDHAAAEQQRQHRLAHHLEDDAQRRAPVRPRQFVVALGLQPRLGFCLAEAMDRTGQSNFVGHFAFFEGLGGSAPEISRNLSPSGCRRLIHRRRWRTLAAEMRVPCLDAVPCRSATSVMDNSLNLCAGLPRI